MVLFFNPFKIISFIKSKIVKTQLKFYFVTSFLLKFKPVFLCFKSIKYKIFAYLKQLSVIVIKKYL